MKLITYYTQSHKIMYEKYFLDTIGKFNEFEIFSSDGTQHSKSGDYFSSGFNETTKDKISFLIQVLNNSVKKDEIVLFSDVDVIFLRPTKEFLKNYNEFDFVFQNGIGGLNTGFFILKNNDRVKNLLIEVVEKCHLFDNDQIALNHLIKFHPVSFTMFNDEILSVAHVIGPKVWEGENFNIPENTLVFHACWCAGIDKKIKLLNYVRNYKKSEAE